MLSLEASCLLWLASISSSALHLLISAHARTQGDIDAWRSRETETLGDFDEIEFVDVKDSAERMRRVGI